VVLFICQNGNLLPKKVAIVVGIGVLSRCVIVCFNLWEASAVSVSSFHSTAYVYFDSAFSGSTWREICAQLGFDFEQCQIHLI